MTCIISENNLLSFLSCSPADDVPFFSDFKIFSLLLFFSNVIMMCFDVCVCVYPTWGSLSFLDMWVHSFYYIWNFFSHYFFKHFFFSLSPPLLPTHTFLGLQLHIYKPRS